jgi:hypothetical protein
MFILLAFIEVCQALVVSLTFLGFAFKLLILVSFRFVAREGTLDRKFFTASRMWADERLRFLIFPIFCEDRRGVVAVVANIALENAAFVPGFPVVFC